MYAYEVCLVDGSIWFNSGFETSYEAQKEMVELINESGFAVDYFIVKEIDENG